jgi:putative RNA 2'-phosphotransferase
MDKKLTSASKHISLLLRHKPESAGLTLDKEGWCFTEDLINAVGISFEDLQTVVAENDKKRFAFNEDKTKIRASQGHSLEVDLKLVDEKPPQILFHGTKQEFLTNILKEGLEKRNRNHVHLSEKTETAKIVADRRKGRSEILEIASTQMRADGYKFYKSENGVWLTDSVPAKYIKIHRNNLIS